MTDIVWEKNNFNKNKINLFRLFISLLIIGLLVYKLNLTQLYNTIIGHNFVLLILLISLHYFVSAIINAINIKIMLNAMNIRLGFIKILQFNLIAFSIGQFFIGKVGELSLAYLLKKEGINYGLSSSLIIVDKIITLISLVLVASFGFFIFFPVYFAVKITIILLALLTVTIFLVFSSRSRDWIKRFILRKYAPIFTGFANNLTYLLKERKLYLFLDFCFSGLRIFITASVTYIILTKIYNVNINYFLIPVINSAGILTTLIPISVSGLGFMEGTIIYLYSTVGVSMIISGAVTLSLRFFYYFYSAIILLIYFNWQKKDNKNNDLNFNQ